MHQLLSGIEYLHNLKVVMMDENGRYKLSTCGKLINLMQLSVDLGLMVYYGVLLGIPTEIAVIVATLEASDKAYPFQNRLEIGVNHRLVLPLCTL